MPCKLANSPCGLAENGLESRRFLSRNPGEYSRRVSSWFDVQNTTTGSEKNYRDEKRSIWSVLRPKRKYEELAGVQNTSWFDSHSCSFFFLLRKPSKYHLTYAFDQSTPAEAQAAVARAFATWAGNTQFSFSQAQSYENADLKISFGRGDHGDENTFDGRGGTLSHAFAPTNGRFHYDADEPWAVGAVEGAYDLETVALHEIGHLLGLGHSSVEGAVMSSSVRTRFTQSLHADDIQGIKALYNTQ